MSSRVHFKATFKEKEGQSPPLHDFPSMPRLHQGLKNFPSVIKTEAVRRLVVLALKRSGG
jgi:hypothetical protein